MAINYALVALLRYIIIVLAISHWMACAWWVPRGAVPGNVLCSMCARCRV